MATFVVLGLVGLIWVIAASLDTSNRKQRRSPPAVASGDSYLNPMLEIWGIAEATGETCGDVFLMDSVGDRLREEARVQIAENARLRAAIAEEPGMAGDQSVSRWPDPERSGDRVRRLARRLIEAYGSETRTADVYVEEAASEDRLREQLAALEQENAALYDVLQQHKGGRARRRESGAGRPNAKRGNSLRRPSDPSLG